VPALPPRHPFSRKEAKDAHPHCLRIEPRDCCKAEAVAHQRAIRGALATTTALLALSARARPRRWRT
jgi:hypothetical protein